MSKHPVTPMLEADIRLHLSKQTSKPIGLIDVTQLEAAKLDIGSPIVLIDLLSESQLATVGRLISRSRFIVGSSGVEAALLAHWKCERQLFPPVEYVGPILAVCGSCSPVTARQMDWAASHGFENLPFDAADARLEATRALQGGRSVVIHTLRSRPDETLGRIVRDVLETTRIRRMLVAGGDTAGAIARSLDIESLEMIGELTRGSPLCRATAPSSPADGIEITFKGGQIGPVDFFGLVEKGNARG